MSGQYFRMSDLGEADMTFDAEPPPSKEPRRRIAEPTAEQINIEKKRRKGAKSFSGEIEKPEPLHEDPYEETGDVDALLYGAHGASPPVTFTPPPEQHAPHPSPKPKKADYLPYLAGMAVLGFLIFFIIQKRRGA